jgi:hypothetical protein
MPRKIVGTEGTIKVLLSEYQVYECFIILNNCAIQNSKLGIKTTRFVEEEKSGQLLKTDLLNHRLSKGRSLLNPGIQGECV